MRLHWVEKPINVMLSRWSILPASEKFFLKRAFWGDFEGFYGFGGWGGLGSVWGVRGYITHARAGTRSPKWFSKTG
jgi:hypothetical protein